MTVSAASGTTGRFVYAANRNSYTLSGFVLDQATGALTAVPGSSVSTSYQPWSVTSHPHGRYVYVGTEAGVTGFSSNATTGQLTSIAGNSPAFGWNGTFPYAVGVAITPTGRYVYSANNNTASVSAYMVDGANGALTLIATYPAGQCLSTIAVEPAGKFVYVGSSCVTGIWGYAIDEATGALTAVSGAPFGTARAGAVTAAPNGQVLYASDSGQLRGYTINGTTGALTLISGFPVTAGVTTQFSGLTLDPTGRFLYAAGTAGQVAGFSVDAVTGGVTAVAGSPFAVAASSASISAAVDASGKFLYVSNYNTSSGAGAVAAFAINQSTGALAAAAGAPFATGGNQTYAVTTTGAVVGASATLQSVEISPTAPAIVTVTQGRKQQFVLLGHYSDGTTQWLTESATWSSSATGIATVSNTAGSKGLATTVGYGSTTITATVGSFDGDGDADGGGADDRVAGGDAERRRRLPTGRRCSSPPWPLTAMGRRATSAIWRAGARRTPERRR